MVVVLLLWMSTARAGEPAGAAELQARIDQLHACTLDGPAPGQVLTRKEEDGLLLGQLQAKAKALQELERVAGTMMADRDPTNDVLAASSLVEGYLHMADAIVSAQPPSYLTEDQAELYQMALEDKAWPLRVAARTQITQLEALIGPFPTEEEELDVWLLRYRSEPSRPLGPLARCVVPPISDRASRARKVLALVRVNLDHLRVDLETWGSCLPTAKVDEARTFLEQVQMLVDEEDFSMASDVLPFLDEIQAGLHGALPAACGVGDHRQDPVTGLPLPPRPCLSSPLREAVLVHLDRMEAEEEALGPAPTAAARRELAMRWLQASRELFLVDPFWMDYDDEASVHVRGALIAVDRAARHLDRARATPGLDAEERARVIESQAEVLRWWAFIWAIYEGRPPDIRKFQEH